jgi:hypothetical protein
LSASQQISGGKKGKKGKKPVKEGPEPPGGGYISVYDFFQKSEVFAYPGLLETMVNSSASLRHHYLGSQYAHY